MSDLSLTFPEELVTAIAAKVVELIDQRAVNAREPEPWISVDEAAAYIGKPKSRLYQLAAANEIPHGRDGRSILFRRSELDAYLLAHRNGGTP